MASLQGWGRQTWNSGAWDTFAPVDATGNGLSSALGSLTLTGDCNITLTGIGTTLSQGTAVGTGVAEVSASGFNIASSLGTETVTGTSAVTLTGLGLQAQLGDESATGVAQSGWNRGVAGDSEAVLGWSDNLWGTTQSSYGFSGNELTSSTGTSVATADFNITVTGVGLTSAAGQIGGSVEAGSLVATSSIGTFSITGDAQLTVVAASEPELDASVGQATIQIGKTAFPPGNALTASLGTEVVTGNAIVTATGVNSTSTVGTGVATTDVELIGEGGFVTKVVTVVRNASDTANIYAIDGVPQPTLELVEGVTYRFDQADNSNDTHGLRFSETSDGTHAGGSAYTTGVTVSGTPGQAGAYTEITVATSAPTLYYYCVNHSGMGGQANTPASSVSQNIFTANGLQISEGDPTISAGATVSATGNALALSLGEESQETSYEAPSVSITSSVGVANIRTDVVFTITGVSATSSTGNLQGTFWSQVDDSNSDISWTEVHKAA